VQREATSTFAFQIANVAAGAIANIVIARTLGPDGKGILALLGYGLFLATSLGALGGQAASVHLIGKGRFSKEEISASVGFSSLLAGIVCTGAMWVLFPHFRGTVPLTPIMIGATAAAVIPVMLRLNLSGIFLAGGRISAYNLTLSILSIGWMVGGVVLLVLFHGGITSAVLLWAAIQFLGSVAGVIWVIAIAPPRPARFVPALRASLGFGLQTYIVSLIWILVLRVDSFILAHYRPAAEVGIYSVAVLVAEVVLNVPRSMTLPLNRRFASGGLLPAGRLAARAARIGGTGVLLLGIGILIVARTVVPLVFGRSFAASVPPLLWLLPGILALAIVSPLSLYLVQQRGKPIWTGTAASAGLIVNIGLNLIWIPRRGAVGAAWASSVAYTLHMVIVSLVFRRETGLGWREILVPRREDLKVWLDLARFARNRNRS
jgi:O-antigen/teichoic acid export membrane protein